MTLTRSSHFDKFGVGVDKVEMQRSIGYIHYMLLITWQMIVGTHDSEGYRHLRRDSGQNF